MKTKNDFVAVLWSGDDRHRPVKKTLDTYYASGEQKLKDQDLCINIGDNSQVVVGVKSVIKLLKKYKRI
jgi:hypothetical protein